eukprot:Tamp_26486.p1 GENE.Tamp_26486~~Tamp_26486.p1  ORF type:complete len:286 (-),score=65.74 Tamp_26486:37-837(-)
MAALAEITAMLAKKGTFMQAVRRLTEEFSATYGGSGEAERLALFNAAKRAYTLLCSRYTAVGFWRVGSELFTAVYSACSSQENDTEKSRAKTAKEWLHRASEEVGKGEEESKGTPDPPAPAPAPSPAHRHDESVPADDALRNVLHEYVQDVDVEQLLSLIQLHAAGASNDGGAPPASREARFNLPVKTINEKDVVCCVCQEEFVTGGKAKMMPCGHPFHYECLIEWLERHNSCPICRFALPSEKPTFDIAQERVASRDVAGTQLYS